MILDYKTSLRDVHHIPASFFIKCLSKFLILCLRSSHRHLETLEWTWVVKSTKNLIFFSCRLDKLEYKYSNSDGDDCAIIKKPCESMEELVAIPVETKEDSSSLVGASFQHFLVKCKYLTTF